MSYWTTAGLKGSSFEEQIELTNNLYKKYNLAIIQKVPTPITPIEVDNKARIITKAFFEKKSTVDFIGVAQGVPICFDAKETHLTNFPLKNIHEHQIDFMDSFRKQKGVSFLIVHFTKFSKMYFLPSKQLSDFYAVSKSTGRKSIPLDDFEEKYEIKNTSGFPVHYLVAVNEYLRG